MNDFSPEDQAQLDQSLAAVEAGRQQDRAEAASAKIDPSTSLGGVKQTFNPVERWLGELPTNASIGLVHLAVNSADAIKHFGAGVSENFKQLIEPAKLASGESAPAPVEPPPSAMPPHDHDGVYDVVKSHVLNFADDMARTQQERGGGGIADSITQSAIQFAVPFTGFSKLLGGLRGASKLATFGRTSVVGALTDTAAMDAHAEQSGRAADLLALARHTDGKLGDVMLSIAPDGSLLNRYIDWMTDRNGESLASGAVKNILDGFKMNTALTGLLHTGIATVKGGYAVAKYAAANAGELGPSGLKAQNGMVAFHGTAADFAPTASNPLGEFDLSKVGTGEGAQVRGFGTYLAESPDTAGTYQKMLGRRNLPAGSALELAHQAVSAHNGDIQKAYATLKYSETTARDIRSRDVASRAAELVRGGNVKRLGNLYHVHVDDAVVGKMLNQDIPMSEQPAVLRKIPAADKRQLEQVLEDHGQDTDLGSYNGNQFRQLVERAINEDYLAHPPVNGIGGNEAQDAADYFLKHDIPGSTFLDQGSRAKAPGVRMAGQSPAGTRNLVLFDPKSHAKIIKKE